jgi:thymidylate synthase (FAD)
MKVANIEVTLLDYMGSDLSVVNAARVSFDKQSDWDRSPHPAFEQHGIVYDLKLSEQDKKLITYLAKHNHKSPFNHAFLSFRVKAPIFVARQLVKHKFLPWNEVSRRYVDDEPEFFFPETYRAKAADVKQGSSDEPVTFLRMQGFTEQTIENGSTNLVEHSLILYNDMLEAGVCAEQARMVLPQNTMTEWIWSGSLGAFADMCKLRLDPHAQKESRDVAELIAKEMRNLFPVSFQALLSV